jgi:NADPH-dependent 7-cyano-7-deazaguanine reductase QueF
MQLPECKPEVVSAVIFPSQTLELDSFKSYVFLFRHVDEHTANQIKEVVDMEAK